MAGKTTFIRYLINGFQKKYNLETTEVTSQLLIFLMNMKLIILDKSL